MSKPVLISIAVFLLTFSCYAQSELRVGGTSTGGDKPIAVVNDKIVKIGDLIDKVKVVEIGDDFVKFEYNGICFVKKIEPPSVSVEEAAASEKSSKQSDSLNQDS